MKKLSIALLLVALVAAAPQLKAQFQENSSAVTLFAGGATATPTTPAVVWSPSGTPVLCGMFSPLQGLPYDLVMSMQPLVSGLATLPSGQVVNIDITQPTVTFNGGISGPGNLNLAWTVFSANFSFVADLPVGSRLSGQAVIANPASLDGVSLSQGATLAEGFGPAVFGSLSLADESVETVALGFPFTYFGSTYTEVSVGSNGQLSFGASLIGAANELETAGVPVIQPWAADLNVGASVVAGHLGARASVGFNEAFIEFDRVPVSGSATEEVSFLVRLAPNRITITYGSVSAAVGRVGMGPGTTGSAYAADLSFGGLIPAGLGVTEDNPTDLSFGELSWTLDAGGNPISWSGN